MATTTQASAGVDRRGFLGSAGVGAALLALGARGQAQEGAAQRPNILHLHTDDHRPDGLHALGNEVLQTPNLDTLVERGTVFSRCYTQGSMVGAVCLPSRIMLLSGRSLFRIPARPDQAGGVTPLPTALAAAGYQTWHMGKGGNEFTAGLQAFQTNLLDPPKADRAGSSQRHADAAIEFLRRRDPARPFYVYLAPPVPHDPRQAPPEFQRLYDPATVPLLPAFQPLHPWDNGDMTVRDEKLAPWPRTPENTRQHLADYYACITCFDHHVGRIFAALRESGQWDHTIVVFTGDNGLSLGEHGLFGKQNLYEFGGMHVPCVVAGPGIPHGRSTALVYLMDLFPTFCDHAGASLPEGVEGHSLRPVIEGRTAAVRDVLYTAYQKGQRALRDDRWKLIRYPLVDRTQLFDLDADPHELDNLAGRPEHAERVVAMTRRLAQEMQTYADPASLTVADLQPAAWTPPPPGTGG